MNAKEWQMPSRGPREGSSSSCVCASRCLLSLLHNKWRDFLQAPVPDSQHRQRGRTMRRKRERGSGGDNGGTHTRTGHVQTQAKTEVYVRTHTLIKQAHMQAVWITAMRPNATWKRSKGTKKRKKTTQGKLQHKGPEPYQNQDCRFNFIQSALTSPSRARSRLVSAVASTSSRLLGEVKSPAVVRNVPSVHTVRGPERHMNSPERTKPPTYSSSTRRNGCGECVLLFYSPPQKTNVQPDTLTPRLRRGTAYRADVQHTSAATHIASSRATDSAFLFLSAASVKSQHFKSSWSPRCALNALLMNRSNHLVLV